MALRARSPRYWTRKALDRRALFVSMACLTVACISYLYFTTQRADCCGDDIRSCSNTPRTAAVGAVGRSTATADDPPTTDKPSIVDQRRAALEAAAESRRVANAETARALGKYFSTPDCEVTFPLSPGQRYPNADPVRIAEVREMGSTRQAGWWNGSHVLVECRGEPLTFRLPGAQTFLAVGTALARVANGGSRDADAVLWIHESVEFVWVRCGMAQAQPVVPFRAAAAGGGGAGHPVRSVHRLAVQVIMLDSISRRMFDLSFARSGELLHDAAAYGYERFQLRGVHSIMPRSIANKIPLYAGTRGHAHDLTLRKTTTTLWELARQWGIPNMYAGDFRVAARSRDPDSYGPFYVPHYFPPCPDYNASAYSAAACPQFPVDHLFPPLLIDENEDPAAAAEIAQGRLCDLAAAPVSYALMGKQYACIGGAHVLEQLGNYTEAFFRAYRDSLRFGAITLHTSHEPTGVAHLSLDAPLERLLRRLLRLQNNTAFFIVSDHGPQIGERATDPVGAVEIVLPTAHILMPRWYLDAHPRAAAALAANQERLTTMYDIHETMRALLSSAGADDGDNGGGGAGPRERIGSTLLEPLPPGRSCRTLGIAPQTCTCGRGETAVVPSEPGGAVDPGWLSLVSGAHRFATRGLSGERLEAFDSMCLEIAPKRIVGATYFTDSLYDGKCYASVDFLASLPPHSPLFRATVVRAAEDSRCPWHDWAAVQGNTGEVVALKHITVYHHILKKCLPALRKHNLTPAYCLCAK